MSVHGVQKLERGATHPYRDTAQRLIAALQLEAEDKSSFEAAVAPVRRHSATPAAEPPVGGRHNLPLSTTRLIGRETAIDEVVGRLADTRLLTLTGVGGCGKTRLALEVARSLLDDYRDAVWLVELGPVVDPALVAPRVAAVLGIRETAEQSLAGVLASALRDRQILLIVDNCEHLLDACAHLIDGLLKACPDLKVLATSREPIGIDGEVAWRVPSLAVPEAASTETPQQLLLNAAVQLFMQRSTAAQPSFMLTARNASSVVQICRRLDGIPLALELAAARIDSLTAEQIARRLDQRFQLLTGGSRAVLPRQQTLSATLRWSYDLLGRAERRLFERLTVFSGGWSLEAAAAVCAGNGLNGDEILDLLAQLTRKSLVVADERADGGERYWMLETVRDYARQKLIAPRQAYAWPFGCSSSGRRVGCTRRPGAGWEPCSNWPIRPLATAVECHSIGLVARMPLRPRSAPPRPSLLVAVPCGRATTRRRAGAMTGASNCGVSSATIRRSLPCLRNEVWSPGSLEIRMKPSTTWRRVVACSSNGIAATQ